jgi:hypothetical protein
MQVMSEIRSRYGIRGEKSLNWFPHEKECGSSSRRIIRSYYDQLSFRLSLVVRAIQPASYYGLLSRQVARAFFHATPSEKIFVALNELSLLFSCSNQGHSRAAMACPNDFSRECTGQCPQRAQGQSGVDTLGQA